MLLKISSFNIRCYGTSGEYKGPFNKDRRNDTLQKFIEAQVGDSDVIIFQEIMDLEAFKNLIPNYEIRSYSHNYKRHQHVVIAYKNKYNLIDSLENNYTLSEVAINQKSSRPAIMGLLVDKRTQKPLVHIIGVHLKSGDLHTQTRLGQVDIIVKALKRIDNSVPTIIAGDFNTRSPESKKTDVELIGENLFQVGFTQVKNSNPTYVTPWEKQSLDHFWITTELIPQTSFWVYKGPWENETEHQVNEIKKYYNEVSDHLPISITINLTKTF